MEVIIIFFFAEEMFKNFLKDIRNGPTIPGDWDFIYLKSYLHPRLSCICPRRTAVRHYFRGPPARIRPQDLSSLSPFMENCVPFYTKYSLSLLL